MENQEYIPHCFNDLQEVTNIREKLPVDEEANDLAEFFKVFGDPTRIRILSLLAIKELCVHDISGVLGMQQTAISHQLKVLRQNRLVKYRKDGKQVYYALSDSHIKEIFQIGLEHVNEQRRSLCLN